MIVHKVTVYLTSDSVWLRVCMAVCVYVCVCVCVCVCVAVCITKTTQFSKWSSEIK